MAKAEFATPVVERNVVLTMTESQAHKLRTILGMSGVSATEPLGDLAEALLKLFPERLKPFDQECWRIVQRPFDE